jgi:hypothetical protein
LQGEENIYQAASASRNDCNQPAGSVAAAAANTALPPAATATSKNYGDALTKALLFYESQRSGNLPVRYLAWYVATLLRPAPLIAFQLLGPTITECAASLGHAFAETWTCVR